MKTPPLPSVSTGHRHSDPRCNRPGCQAPERFTLPTVLQKQYIMLVDGCQTILARARTAHAARITGFATVCKAHAVKSRGLHISCQATRKNISIPPPLRGGWGGVKTEIFHFRGGLPPPHT